MTSDGTRVLESDKDRAAGKPATLSDVRTVYPRGTDLLRPAYDLYGQLWVVDRTAGGARLSVVRAGTARTVAAPGLTGEPVVRFVLSRDGTRLVSQVRRDGVDRLFVSRVQRDATGRVRGLLPARALPLTGFEGDQIRDLGWRAPGCLAVLSGPNAGTSQVLVVKIDGSSRPEDLSTDAELFRDQAVRLVTAPSVGAPLYIRTIRGQLFSLATTGRWTGTSIEPGLDSPTFVGWTRPSPCPSRRCASAARRAGRRRRRRCCRRTRRSSRCRRSAPAGPCRPAARTAGPPGARPPRC